MPTQTLYLSTAVIKRPTWPDNVISLTDMLDFSEPRRTSGEDIIQQARSAMTTANNASPQSRLCTGRSINCSAPPFEGLPPGVPAEPCLLRRLDANDTSDTTDATLELTTQQNRGPLLTTTLALFGYGSFIAERMERPEAYLYPSMTWEEYKAQPNPSACVGKAPFVGLLHTDIDSSQTGSYL